MLEFMTKAGSDAIAILRKDHDKVRELFDQFEKADSLRQKKKIVAEAIMELKIHATIEEELLYPALRKQKVEKDLLNEADEEHHVAKLLIAELDKMDGSEDHYEAKFIVLAENIRHHIKEEEGEMFPQARKTAVDFAALGKQLLMRKQQLMKNGVPTCAEEKMIFAYKGNNDSPAQAASIIKSPKLVLMKPAKRSAAAKTGNTSKKGAVSQNKATHKNLRSAKRG